LSLATKDTVQKFMKSDNFWVSLIRETMYALAAVGAIALVLYLYAGSWPPMVSVDGLSMYPNMHDGDLIIIQSIEKSPIVTYDAAGGRSSFGDAGDVIVYQPFGRRDMTPVIHRALYYVNASEPMWEGASRPPTRDTSPRVTITFYSTRAAASALTPPSRGNGSWAWRSSGYHTSDT